MAEVICYASRTGTKRNLAALRAAGWRLLISRVGEWKTDGFAYALDNGAWSDFQRGTQFDDSAFERLIIKLGAGADWIVLPDIVAGGLESLKFSIRWLNRTLDLCPLVLIAVQDGMTPDDVRPYVGPSCGIFLGGSTPWKIASMGEWGAWAAGIGIHYHVARVNTFGRFKGAIAAGATSVDGSSATRYASTMPSLERWSSHPDLFSVRKGLKT